MSSTNLEFAKRCEFSLKVDDVVSEIPISDTSFTLFDSIYELYPKVSMTLKDVSGIYNEYLGFVNGTKMEISYGIDLELWKKCTYRVIQNSMPEQNNPNVCGGILDFSLIHDYFSKQSKMSRAFNSNISDIIRTLIKRYPFSSVDIDTTLNSGLWYQPNVTDADFIMNYLLPFSYSTSCENTPFYCFIDSNNGFHFKNYRSLTRQNPKQTFYLKSKGILSGVAKDTIMSMSYAQVPTSELKPFYNRLIYSFDNNGNYVKDSDAYITDYPNSEINPLPIKVNINQLTGTEELYNDDIELEETKNNNLGLITNKMQKSMVNDKLIITVPFNREIRAGDLITIVLPSPTENVDSGESSLRFSSNYIVEASYQKWDGRSSTTILVCSKQTIKVTNNYRNIALVLNRN